MTAPPLRIRAALVGIVAAAAAASILAAGAPAPDRSGADPKAGYDSVASRHPFVLWTPGELEAIRHRIETQPWAASEWKRKPENRAEASLHDLLAHRLFGDREAGERQKARLLRTVRSRPPLGGAQWVNVVIYDMAYDLLSDAERVEIEGAFRRFIDQAIFRNALFDPGEFDTSRDYQRYDALAYTRGNWLPNIAWPRRVSANLMAAALGEEDLIRRVWAHYGSWQWYFDEYLSDGGFYGEEFSKMGATPGAMLIYCRAVRHLGLDALGFGYRGRTGSTMRGHIESVIRLGYPRVDLHSERFHYPMLTTGDLRGEGSSRQGKDLPTYAFQHSIVRGFLPGAAGGAVQRWQAHGAWGGEQRGTHPQWDGYSDFTPKMQIPLWFEAGHAEWPDAGFDYFLAQMRAPDAEAYVPTLYFGVEPLRPPAVKPPVALSWVAPDRGLAMLRADESPSYWESAKPAVGVRLAADYAHHVNDSFTLSGFYAFGRPIYLNRQTRRGYAFGYSRSVLSHAGVLVDGREPGFTARIVARHAFHPPVKILVAESPGIYGGIEASRALFLTDRYLLDIFRLSGGDDREQAFTWLVHALGETDLAGAAGWTEAALDGPLSVFEGARARRAAPEGASVTIVQNLALDEPSEAQLPPAWYRRGVGIRVALLGDEKTDLVVARTPVDDPENQKLSDPEGYLELAEVGGTSVIARRRAPRTTFITFHLPFEGGTPPPVRAVAHPTGMEAAIAVEVIDDRDGPARDWLLLDLRDEAARRGSCPIEIPGKGRFRFVDQALVRITAGGVDAWGDLRALRIKPPLGAAAIFRLNDRATKASVADGDLVFPP
ncbi:MAG: hypothetical protein JXP34_27765 [Planctomycetes bacterium]|nr:hypothetical protein [Planctomycetota bacterium]